MPVSNPTQQQWSLPGARRIAAEYLSTLGRRWRHVQQVGSVAESFVAAGKVSEVVAVAAWLHDIGYAAALARTGFHPLDGGRFLQARGASDEIVGLVGYHTGAMFEADERGLLAELQTLPKPDQDDQDLLTYFDLSVGPDGTVVDPKARVEEILTRYAPGHPVHKAVARSQSHLLRVAERAERRIGTVRQVRVSASV